MDGNTSDKNVDDNGWTTEDEIDKFTFDASPGCGPLPIVNSMKSTTLASCSGSKLMDRFIEMGFDPNIVAAAIKDNGEEDEDTIIEALVKFGNSSGAGCSGTKRPGSTSTAGCSGTKRPILYDSDTFSNEAGSYDDSSDFNSSFEKEEPLASEEKNLLILINMGYPKNDATIAIERCGPDATIIELTDFISAAQLAPASDVQYVEEEKVNNLLLILEIYMIYCNY
ncbi:hypothetical protein ACFE04_009923 [Oxalis oulophora]